MKLMIFIMAFAVNNLNTSGQGVFANDTYSALQTVIYEFNKGFPNIKGQLISATASRSEYKCNLEVPGVLSSSITKYKVSGKDMLSWKAVLFTTNDFSLASQKYKEVFDKIVNAIIKSGDETPYILNGSFETPTESSSNSIILSPLPMKGEMENVKVELSLQKKNGYLIALRVYDKRVR
jgi:hypothetical protein